MTLVTEAVHKIVTRYMKGARKFVRLQAKIAIEILARPIREGRKVLRLLTKVVSEPILRREREVARSSHQKPSGVFGVEDLTKAVTIERENEGTLAALAVEPSTLADDDTADRGYP